MYQFNIDGKFYASSGVLMDILRLLNKPEIKRNAVEVFHAGKPLVVVLNDYGKYGIQQEGSIEEIFLRMLNEVDVHYIRPRGEVLQPWQMMPDDWRAFTMLGSAAYNVYPCFTDVQRRELLSYTDYAGRETTGSIEYYMMAEMFRRYGYNHNGPLYGPSHDSNSRHEVQVAYALAEGKPVPDEVIQWYKSNPKEVGSVCSWFQIILDWPEYRGTISVGKLRALEVALKGSTITLTNENAPYFIRQMAVLKADASFTDVDDHLYQLGVIKPREVKLTGEMPDVSVAYSLFALELRNRLGENRKQDAIELANEQRVKYHHTLRQMEEELVRAEMLPDYEPFTYPNKFAEAIDKKDVGYLLTFLDTPDDRNVVTKKAVRDVFGFKVLGLKSAERRSAVFAFCGFDASQRAQYELAADEKAAEVRREREIKQVREKAESNKIRLYSTSEVITVAEYVDRSVAEGYTTITTSKKGATTQYWLSNLQSGCSRSVQKKDGSLEYAQLVHGLTVQRLAA